MKINIFLLILLLSADAIAETDYIAVVTLNTGFIKAVEYCKFKHPESAEFMDDQYQQWTKKHKKILDTGYTELEEKSKESPEMVKKAQGFAAFQSKHWVDLFLPLTYEESSEMCSSKSLLFNTFSFERLRNK